MNLISVSYAGRASKSLSVPQRKEIEGIIKKHQKQIKDSHVTDTCREEKKDVINILEEKAYNEVCNILKHSYVIDAPKGLIGEIEGFQRKHSIKVFALHTSGEENDYIIIIPDNNASELEVKRSILHEAFALAGNSYAFKTEIESDVLEDILRWPLVRSTNLTTYKGRYHVLISEFRMLIGRRRDLTIVDFGCGFDSEEFTPISFLEMKRALDMKGDRGFKFIAVDQIDPYYVLAGEGQLHSLLFDLEGALVAFQSKAGHLVDCQSDIATSIRITKERLEERKGIIENRNLYEAILQVKLGKNIDAIPSIDKEVEKYSLVTDPLKIVHEEKMEFVCNRYFGLGRKEAIDVGIVYNVFLHYSPKDIQKYVEIITPQIKEGGFLIVGDIIDYRKKSVKEEITIYKKENGKLRRFKFIFWVKPRFDEIRAELTDCNACLTPKQHELLNTYFRTKEYYDSGEILGFESFSPSTVVYNLRRKLGIVAVVHDKEAVLIEFNAQGEFKKLPEYVSLKEPPKIQNLIKEIRKWKDRNKKKPADDEYLRELKRFAMDVYNHNRAYRLPLHQRMAFARAVFDRTRFPIVNAAISSIYRALTTKGLPWRLDPKETLCIVPPEAYHILANRLSVIESRCSMVDNRAIRFAINVIIYDFLRNGEKRFTELSWLVGEIEKELENPGSGSLPTIIAMQDLHGGSKRALSLIGHALGLDRNVYQQINNLSDLKLVLIKRDIVVRDLDIRFVGINDKYDRGEDPEGIFKLVRWLRSTGKAKPFIGNHDFWRLLSVLGVHLIPGVSMEKNHGIGYWAKDAMRHAGWGTIELDQVNERRFNHEIDRVNITLELYRLPLIDRIDLGSFRGNISKEMKRLKKLNAEIRRNNEVNKDNPNYTRKEEHPLPDIFNQTLSYLRTQVVDRSAQISTINAENNLDIKSVEFREVNLKNYMDDKDIIDRTLWELQNFRLFYIDILGNIHLHNILPMDFNHRHINVVYKGLRGIPALEMMQEDVRSFFENMATIPNSNSFRQKMWEILGDAFKEINRWYSDKDAYAKPVSVKRFIECGGPAGFGGELLGASVKQFADRQSTFLMVMGHNERRKFDDPSTPIPWIVLSPETSSGLTNIDYELSQGYKDRGAYLSFFKRDEKGEITGIKQWGYPVADEKKGRKQKDVSVIKDITLTDIEGLTDEQKEMLISLTDGKNFMKWYRIKALTEMRRLLTVLIEGAGKIGRFEKEVRFKKLQISTDAKIDKEENTSSPKMLRVFEV